MLDTLASFMTVGGFRGGAEGGAAALFSAVAGGTTGAALRSYRAIATREIEATRRVTEERLRIARDLHDVIAHQVAMLSVHLGLAEVALPTAPSRRGRHSRRRGCADVLSSTRRSGSSCYYAAAGTRSMTRRCDRRRRSADWDR